MLSLAGGNLEPNGLGSASYVGAELAFNCLLLAPPTGAIRTKLSYGSFDHAGVKLSTLELNPRWMVNVTPSSLASVAARRRAARSGGSGLATPGMSPRKTVTPSGSTPSSTPTTPSVGAGTEVVGVGRGSTVVVDADVDDGVEGDPCSSDGFGVLSGDGESDAHNW